MMVESKKNFFWKLISLIQMNFFFIKENYYDKLFFLQYDKFLSLYFSYDLKYKSFKNSPTLSYKKTPKVYILL